MNTNITNNEPIRLTPEEVALIKKLNDPLYTPEFIEHWVNRDDNCQINAIAALQACSAKGYYKAVRNMLKQGIK